ncbi:MAG: beta-propeller fold lactonase family protein [Planctomycetales bacterium]
MTTQHAHTRLLTRLAAALAIAAMASFAAAGTSNSLMDISSDGSLLACSNRDSGTVTFVDLATNKVLREVPVGHKPEGVSFIGSSHEIAVAVYDDDTVVILDGDSGNSRATVSVFDEPYGIVSTKDGSRIFVTLEYPGQVLEIDPRSAKITRTFSAGAFTRGIAITPDEKQLLVCEFLTATVRAIDRSSGKLVDEWPGSSTDNLARQLAIHPKRPKAYVTFIRSKVTAHQGTGSIFPYVAITDLVESEDTRRKRMPLDSVFGTLVTANPWEIAISPDGRQLYVVFSGTDDIFVCNTIDDDYRELSLAKYIATGRNPRAVRVSPDGSQFFVYNALDFEVVVFDAKSLRQTAKIPITKNPLSSEVHLGKVLFYTALQPMTGRRWISCSSCHPDGQPDARTWHNPEGLRQTPPLHGLAFTHPQHWSADRDETQDFEHTIRGPLMGGRGLHKGRLNKPLGETNKGLSASLDALAAYTNSHRFTLSPYAKGGLSAAAERGRKLFTSKQTKCAECHSGPFLTDSQSGKSSVRHDVGTGTGDDSETMGTSYDTPTLLGLYRSAPYLHHGTAATLRDVLTTQNGGDKHGATSQLSQSESADLVEFLKALPYELPEPLAKDAGIVKVSY